MVQERTLEKARERAMKGIEYLYAVRYEYYGDGCTYGHSDEKLTKEQAIQKFNELIERNLVSQIVITREMFLDHEALNIRNFNRLCQRFAEQEDAKKEAAKMLSKVNIIT